jgi:hypothetical protein
MKVFAIITVALMATAGGAYYLTSDSCHSNSSCPIAKLGGCCSRIAPQSCETPCSSGSQDSSECGDICELCCTSGIQVPVNATVSAATPSDEEECPHCKTPANIATSAVTAGVTIK